MLSLYRRLIALRREHEALAVGAISHAAAVGPVLVYRRSLAEARFDIALNTGHAPATVDLEGGTVLADTHRADAYTIERGPVTLAPDQAVLIRV